MTICIAWNCDEKLDDDALYRDDCRIIISSPCEDIDHYRSQMNKYASMGVFGTYSSFGELPNEWGRYRG